jgi:hypothetical protein
MNALNTVVNAVSNFFGAVASMLVPSGASIDARTKAELAIIGGHQAPEWLQQMQAEMPIIIRGDASLLMVRGAKPVLSAGTLDGSDQLALVRFWGAPDAGNPQAKGATIYARTETGKTFAYFRAWGSEAGKPAPAEVSGIDPETGEALAWRLPVPEHLACAKFKLDGLGGEYEAAVHAIASYVATQDGSRQDYILLAQCNGEERLEANTLGVPVTINGKGVMIQPIKGYILFRVPKVSGRGDANLAKAFAPKPKMADAADTTADQASARVTPVMSVSVSALASAEQL